MAYTQPTLSGYNSNPPPDDGSTGASNTVSWATHKNKLGDPLKTYSQAIDAAIVSAFTDLSKAFVLASDYGTNTTAVQDAIDSLSPNGGIVAIGTTVSYTYSSLTIPSNVFLIDAASSRIIMSGMALEPPTQQSGHLLFRHATANTAARVHLEPNSYVSGTASKIDLMLDPYEDDGTNYRLGNIYTKTYSAGDSGTTQGDNGVVVLGVKGVGDFWGVFPSLHVGFNDDSSTGVPMKVMLFDTADSSWRTPLLGAWRTGISVSANDYVLAGYKLYQADGSGTTGATEPTHGAGSASDGSVSWTFIRDFQASGTFAPVVMIGNRDSMPKFGLSNTRMQFAGDATFWNDVEVNFLDSAHAVAWKMKCLSLTDDLYIYDDTETRFMRFGDTFIQKAGLSNLLATTTISDNDTTPDVTGMETAIFSNSSSTSITAFQGTARQLLVVHAGNGNTTIVHGSGITTNTGANKVLTTNSCLMFVADGSGTAWKEVGTL